jgi:recombinational DNA repair protein RecR
MMVTLLLAGALILALGVQLARSESRTIVVPDGDEHIILEVANRYHARYLVLEKEGVLLSLKDLYDHPQDHPLFRYLGEIHATRIFAIETQP